MLVIAYIINNDIIKDITMAMCTGTLASILVQSIFNYYEYNKDNLYIMINLRILDHVNLSENIDIEYKKCKINEYYNLFDKISGILDKHCYVFKLSNKGIMYKIMYFMDTLKTRFKLDLTGDINIDEYIINSKYELLAFILKDDIYMNIVKLIKSHVMSYDIRSDRQILADCGLEYGECDDIKYFMDKVDYKDSYTYKAKDTYDKYYKIFKNILNQYNIEEKNKDNDSIDIENKEDDNNNNTDSYALLNFEDLYDDPVMNKLANTLVIDVISKL